MGGVENDARRGPGSQSLLQPIADQAPPVARLQPGKAELRARRREVVAHALGELEEGRRHLRTHHMAAAVLVSGRATAIAIETGSRIDRARRQRLAEDVD